MKWVIWAAALLGGYASFNLAGPWFVLPMTAWATAPFLLAGCFVRLKWLSHNIAVPLALAGFCWGAWSYFSHIFVFLSSLSANVLVLAPAMQIGAFTAVAMLNRAWSRLRLRPRSAWP